MSTVPTTPSPGGDVRVCYHVQSHGEPRQVERLVGTLLRADPGCLVHVSHHDTGAGLPQDLQAVGDVVVSAAAGGRGRFHMVQRWLDAAHWLREHAPVDFMVTLSGQDYPVRPLTELRTALEDSGDGMLEHFPVLVPGGPWPLREGRTRYLYRWHDLLRIDPRQRDVLRSLHALNRLQPLVRFNASYDSLSVGLRRRSPFGEGLQCWGGSVFTNLSWRSVERVLEVSDAGGVFMDWARGSLVIDEAFFQTILLNSPGFEFVNTSGRYYDFTSTKHGSPATLTVQDLPAAIASARFFARKWDLSTTPEAFDLMDELLGV